MGGVLRLAGRKKPLDPLSMKLLANDVLVEVSQLVKFPLLLSGTRPPEGALLSCVPIPKIRLPATFFAPFAPSGDGEKSIITPLLSAAAPVSVLKLATGFCTWFASGWAIGPQAPPVDGQP